MLCLSRKTDESIVIGDDVIITIIRIRGAIVRVGIEAPRTKTVVRSELPECDLDSVRRTIDSLNNTDLGRDYA